MTGGHVPERSRRPDGGFTLIEMLLVMIILGIVMGSLALAVSVTLRASPDTEARVDDARTTRALTTWLAYDTTSTPPHLPEGAYGGIDVTTTPTADNNDCGGEGSNILHLQWAEQRQLTITYVANYRFVVDGAEARLVRYSCFRMGSGPMIGVRQLNLTPDLDPTRPPTAVVAYDADGNVENIAFTLVGATGEQVLIETSSRNPSDFFPT